MDLQSAADELYSLEPGAFTSRRSELVAQAKADGDRELASLLGSLRRPTVAAWLVNRLAAGGELGDLFGLGEAMRTAQAGLQGELLKELSAQRHLLVATLVGRAVAGAPGGRDAVSEAARREVEATLVAAVADAAAADAVSSGRLTRALSYTGFGDVDLDAATALPAGGRSRSLPAPIDLTSRRDAKKERERATHPSTSSQQQPSREERARRAVVARVEAAQAAVETAHAKAQDAGRRRVEAAACAEGLTERAATLQRELSDVRRGLAEATRDVDRGDRAVDQAARAARQAERELAAARAALES